MWISRNGQYLQIDDATWASSAYQKKGWAPSDPPPAPTPPADPGPQPVIIGPDNPVVLTPGTAPANPANGQIYLDTAGVIHAWNGTRWVP